MDYFYAVFLFLFQRKMTSYMFRINYFWSNYSCKTIFTTDVVRFY